MARSHMWSEWSVSRKIIQIERTVRIISGRINQSLPGWPHSTLCEIPCVCIFLHAKMNIFYFLNGLLYLLNHNLNLKIIHFARLVQIPSFP